MKVNKQTQELEARLEQLNAYYEDLSLHLDLLQDKAILRQELLKVLEKAKAWDIFRAKCAKGAKVGASNLSKKERIDRARHASLSKGNKAQKEKALKKVRH